MAQRPTEWENNSRLYPRSVPTPSLHTAPKNIEALPGIGTTIMRNSNYGSGSAIAPYEFHNTLKMKIAGGCGN